jgi:hypothetical protein
MKTLEQEGMRACGIAWIDETDFHRLRRLFDDGHLFDSWEGWRQRAERMEAFVQAEGVVVVRARLDPETFVDWCKARGLRPDGEGRTAFGVEFAAEAYGNDHS